MQFIQWDYAAYSDSVEPVVPDGCRDILIIESDHREPQTSFTHLDNHARLVTIEKQTKMSGFRLRPGASFDHREIDNLGANVSEVKGFIEGASATGTEAIELIEALNDHQASLNSACRQIGVSGRTLQRRFRKLGLPKPEYWRLLSRARKAATALPGSVSLAEVASTYGYSDQPHMTREFVRWFAATPAQIRGNSSLLAEISQPGLGNWTLEQISIR